MSRLQPTLAPILDADANAAGAVLCGGGGLVVVRPVVVAAACPIMGSSGSSSSGSSSSSSSGFGSASGSSSGERERPGSAASSSSGVGNGEYHKQALMKIRDSIRPFEAAAPEVRSARNLPCAATAVSSVDLQQQACAGTSTMPSASSLAAVRGSTDSGTGFSSPASSESGYVGFGNGGMPAAANAPLGSLLPPPKAPPRTIALPGKNPEQMLHSSQSCSVATRGRPPAQPPSDQGFLSSTPGLGVAAAGALAGVNSKISEPAADLVAFASGMAIAHNQQRATNQQKLHDLRALRITSNNTEPPISVLHMNNQFQQQLTLGTNKGAAGDKGRSIFNESSIESIRGTILPNPPRLIQSQVQPSDQPLPGASVGPHLQPRSLYPGQQSSPPPTLPPRSERSGGSAQALPCVPPKRGAALAPTLRVPPIHAPKPPQALAKAAAASNGITSTNGCQHQQQHAFSHHHHPHHIHRLHGQRVPSPPSPLLVIPQRDPPPPYSTHSHTSHSSSCLPPSYASSSSGGRVSPSSTATSSECSLALASRRPSPQVDHHTSGPPSPQPSVGSLGSATFSGGGSVSGVSPAAPAVAATIVKTPKTHSPVIMKSVKATPILKPLPQTAVAPLTKPLPLLPNSPQSMTPSPSPQDLKNSTASSATVTVNKSAFSAYPLPPPYRNSQPLTPNLLQPPPSYSRLTATTFDVGACGATTAGASPKQDQRTAPVVAGSGVLLANRVHQQQQVSPSSQQSQPQQQSLSSHSAPVSPAGSCASVAISSASSGPRHRQQQFVPLVPHSATHVSTTGGAFALASQHPPPPINRAPPSYDSSMAARHHQHQCRLPRDVPAAPACNAASSIAPHLPKRSERIIVAPQTVANSPGVNGVSDTLPPALPSRVGPSSDLVTTVAGVCQSQVSALQGINHSGANAHRNGSSSRSESPVADSSCTFSLAGDECMLSSQTVANGDASFIENCVRASMMTTLPEQPQACQQCQSSRASDASCAKSIDSGAVLSSASFPISSATDHDLKASDDVTKPLTDDAVNADVENELVRHHSPIPRRKNQKSIPLGSDHDDNKMKMYSSDAYKFFMEQHMENVMKAVLQRQQRLKQLDAEMIRAGLSEETQVQMRRMLLQKESNYIRLRRAKMDRSMFRKIAIIGMGAFGEVALVRKVNTQQLYAMKTLRKDDVLKRNQVAHVKAERDILAEADNEWVVKLYYSFQDDKNLYFVMDYIAGGDMMTLLIKLGIFEEKLAQFYIAELTCALESVHKLGFIHRDIKPDNILIDRDGHIKLTDFGLCTGFRWTHNSKYYQRNSDHARQESMDFQRACISKSLDDHDENCPCQKPLERRRRNHGQRCLARSLVGTPNYIAPEVLERHGYGQTCDWWSVGVILYEMLFGTPPFFAQTPLETQQKVIEWERHLIFPNVPNVSLAAVDLIRKLCTGPENRLGRNGADDIKQHNFFAGIDFNTNIRYKNAPFIPKVAHATDTSNFDDFKMPVEEDGSDDKSTETSESGIGTAATATTATTANGGAQNGGTGSRKKTEPAADRGCEHAFLEFTFRRFFDDGGVPLPLAKDERSEACVDRTQTSSLLRKLPAVADQPPQQKQSSPDVDTNGDSFHV